MAGKYLKRKPRRRKKSGWFNFETNIFLVVVFRLFVAFLMFVLSRVLFYFINLNYFTTLSTGQVFWMFVNGLPFDISGVLMINSPYILMNFIPCKVRYHKIYQGFANGYFFVANIFGLFLNFIDTEYFRFTLKRITADIFRYLEVGGDFNKLIPHFIYEFWYLELAWIFLSILLVWLALRFKIKPLQGKQTRTPWVYYVGQFIVFLIAIMMTGIGIRGGIQTQPITTKTAGQFTTARNIPLMLNTPFTIISSFLFDSLETINWFSDEKTLVKVYNPIHHESRNGFSNLNVMIIIMESFSREHVGILNRELHNGHYQGYTPFLDSLIQEGYYFDAYANSKTSIQGVPAILSAIPSLMNESFILKIDDTERIPGIAGLLKKKGYTSAFFHGGTNGTMAFDHYANKTGFDQYYGRTEYNNERDYDGKWGIWDEPFFQYTARIINTLNQPFLVSLFSLSSHHPYNIPGSMKHVFRTGKIKVQQSIVYADYSLSKFFHAAQKMPWYPNTLFVITADHTSECYEPDYQTNLGAFSIPILFFYPKGHLKGNGKIIAQQTDIMPTVLNYLGFDHPYLAFGSDLFDPGIHHFAIHFIDGFYCIYMDKCYGEFDGKKMTAFFNMEHDPGQQKNIAGSGSRKEKELELFLKAFIQQYNNRLIENRLIIR
jgi:phosphoglycerol transferase MdoB-like AlkP superfamily enzyme